MSSAFRISAAAQCLKQGGVIAYPTEGVWGLGCDPVNQRAIRRLMAIKQRSPNKGLILIAANVEQFAPYLAGLTKEQFQQVMSYWPGHTTLIVPDNGYASSLLTGDFGSIALRVTQHRPVVELCNTFGGPIVSTSANRAGREACRWPWQIKARLGDDIDYCLGGATAGINKPSQIIDLLSGRVLRP